MCLTWQVRCLPLNNKTPKENDIPLGEFTFLQEILKILQIFFNPVVIIFPIGEKYFLQESSFPKRNYIFVRFPTGF